MVLLLKEYTFSSKGWGRVEEREGGGDILSCKSWWVETEIENMPDVE